MDPQLLGLFHHQIWMQCKFALLAYENLGAAVAELKQRRGNVDPRYQELISLPDEEQKARAIEIALDGHIQIWYQVQALLTAAANISKALWGQGGKLHVERQPLRDSLSVTDNSPLRPTSMRNNFDHFDDRLDDWWRTSTKHFYLDLSVGDVAAAIRGVPENELFRSYDVGTGDLGFWGQRYNLPLIIDEIKRIAHLALREAAK
jgi:hypothetical protein